MKVVVNRCFGGFGLSTEAMRLLIARKCKAVKIMTEDEYTGGRGHSILSHEIFKKVPDGFVVGYIKDVLYKDGMVYIFEDGERTDPDLVEVVEQIGKKANGEHAELEIVEIPDGIEWEIDEYDGMEHIDEKHRSW